MREIYPPHYAAFHCIAGACPDSCCKEWEIVVDAESVEKYQMVSGELGNRLRQAMITDADGDVIFQEREKRCPFWNAQQLCDIHGGLGEAALCETCRQFPRVTQDYGDFIEYDISPACPEAARLLMELTPEQWLLSENDCPEVTGSFPEYDGKIMQQRKDQRRNLFACLQDTSVPALKQISHCLELVTQWTDFSEGTSDAICTEDDILSFLNGCEVLTEDWKMILTRARENPEVSLFYDAALDKEIRLFGMDMLYRYYLRTAYSDDPFAILLPVQLAAFAVCTVLTLTAHIKIQDEEQRLRIWQLFVKEIEYDGDNLEELEWQLETNAAFSPAALCAYFESVGGA